MKKIGVFCSASTNIDSTYYENARQLGKWIGQNNYTLVYGGSNLGLMGELSKAVHHHNGQLLGIIPIILKDTDKESRLPQKKVYTRSLSDRKDILLEQSDILIALPGGIGTFDEIFHVMGQTTLAYHDKKIILYNINYFYSPLITLLKELQKQKLIRQPLSTYLTAVDNLDDLISLLK